VLLLLLSFLLTDTVCLGLVNSQLIVSRGILLELLFELLAFALQTGCVGSKSLQLSLSSHRLLEEDLDFVEPILLIVQLSSDNVITELAVGSDFLLQVVEHLLRADVLARLLLDIHEALAGREELMLGHFNHVSQLPLLFTKSGVVLLFLAEFRGGVEELLEVSLVTLVLEKVNLSK